MQVPANWTYQTPCPYDVLTTGGAPEVFSFSEPQANTATADFICEWQNRYIVVNHLLGNGVYSATPPVVHPTRTDLYARVANINGMSGIGHDGTWVEYRFARIQVRFVPQPAGDFGGNETNAFISVSSDNGGEYATVPGKSVVWDAPATAWDGKPLEEPPQKYLPKSVHKVVVHQWFAPPFSTLKAARGKINSAAVPWVYETIDAGCLLFETYNVSYDITFNGLTPFKIEMTFLEKDMSWNYFLAKNGFRYLTDPLIYESTSFSGIFP